MTDHQYVVSELNVAMSGPQPEGEPHPERTPVGPFSTREEADTWAHAYVGLHGGTGSWSISPLHAPHSVADVVQGEVLTPREQVERRIAAGNEAAYNAGRALAQAVRERQAEGQMTGRARAGRCRSCGRPLVQVVGERTYHPAVVLPRGATCDALLLIEGTTYYGHDVPDDQFVPDP